MKPFDLEKALAGHPLVTRDGRKVLDFHYFKVMTKYIFPIYAAIESIGNDPYFSQFRIDGSALRNEEESSLDLFLDSTKKTYWVNVYESEIKTIFIGKVFDNEKECSESSWAHDLKKIKTISFEIEE